MSNNLKNLHYYKTIVRDMESFAEKEFFGNAHLLSINVDLERIQDGYDESLAEVKTSVEKKSKDTLFLKSLLALDKKIIVQASAIWTKDL